MTTARQLERHFDRALALLTKRGLVPARVTFELGGAVSFEIARDGPAGPVADAVAAFKKRDEK